VQVAAAKPWCGMAPTARVRRLSDGVQASKCMFMSHYPGMEQAIAELKEQIKDELGEELRQELLGAPSVCDKTWPNKDELNELCEEIAALKEEVKLSGSAELGRIDNAFRATLAAEVRDLGALCEGTRRRMEAAETNSTALLAKLELRLGAVETELEVSNKTPMEGSKDNKLAAPNAGTPNMISRHGTSVLQCAGESVTLAFEGCSNAAAAAAVVAAVASGTIVAGASPPPQPPTLGCCSNTGSSACTSPSISASIPNVIPWSTGVCAGGSPGSNVRAPEPPYTSTPPRRHVPPTASTAPRSSRGSNAGNSSPKGLCWTPVPPSARDARSPRGGG